jgi:hypothetical protein
VQRALQQTLKTTPIAFINPIHVTIQRPIASALRQNSRGLDVPNSLLDVQPAQDTFKQRLRLRRFLLASAFSMLYLAVLAIFYTQDKIDGGDAA